MVVAGDDQHAAEAGGAGVVGVFHGIARAIDAGALAVPHGEDAVGGVAGEQRGHLRAPDRGHGEVFVEAGFEDDVFGLERLGGGEGLDVEPAEG